MYQAGFDKGVTWTPDGGNPVGINITGWNAEDGGDSGEVSHTGTGGEQAFLACLKRCPCNFDANLDGGQSPKSVGLTFGAKGTLSFTKATTANSLSDSIHVFVEKVATKSVVNGVVSFSVTAKSDAINASGQVVKSINIS